MNRLESKLFNLEESLMRNDGMADDSTYYTIVGVANELSELEDENAKLREELESVGMSAYLYDRGDLRADNEKLRELCTRFAEYVSQDRCEGCVVKSRCNDDEVEECWQRTEIRELARGFGIEVD